MSVSTFLDCLPVIARSPHNAVTVSEEARNRAYNLIEAACIRREVQIQLTKSEPYAQDISLRAASWRKHPNNPSITDRRTVVLVFLPIPFYQWETLMSAFFYSGSGWSKTVHHVYKFESEHAEALVDFLLGQRGNKIPKLPRCRMKSMGKWFWYPRNRLRGLRPDPGRAVVPLSFFAGCAICLFTLTAPTLLPLGVAAVMGLPALAGWWQKRRKGFAMLPGKPEQDPRFLTRLDSWQCLLLRVGGSEAAMRQDIQTHLQQAAKDGIVSEPETIWHWGLDGKEERTQIVARYRRAICFIHVYCYGSDLYVSWDAHLNRGTWVERETGRGIDPATGVLCKAATIVTGTQPFTEYDVTDAECLLEWVHGVVTRLCRLLLERYKIEQEIDFSIQREGRRGLVGERDGKKDKKSEGDALHSGGVENKSRFSFKRNE